MKHQDEKLTLLKNEESHLKQLIHELEKDAKHIVELQEESRHLLQEKTNYERANTELNEKMIHYTGTFLWYEFTVYFILLNSNELVFFFPIEENDELKNLLEEHIERLKNAQETIQNLEGEQDHLRQEFDALTTRHVQKCKEQGAAQAEVEVEKALVFRIFYQ